MPTTVEEVFAAADLEPMGVVKWGSRPNLSTPGVYVVSLTKSVSEVSGTLPHATLLASSFDQWKLACPNLTLDGVTPTQLQLMDRIARFWIPDEVILYIGSASASVCDRVGDYYSTKIGARSPHSGGYFLKLLSNLSQLWVHYALCAAPLAAETSMLEYFAASVSRTSASSLHDPERLMPFANLEITTRKRHGIGNARTRRPEKSAPLGKPAPTMSRENITSPSPEDCRTQRVTPSDRKLGQIRIPYMKAAPTKSLFPDKKAKISVTIRGVNLLASWNPKLDPMEKSGVLRIGRSVLLSHVKDYDVLKVSIDESGVYLID